MIPLKRFINKSTEEASNVIGISRLLLCAYAATLERPKKRKTSEEASAEVPEFRCLVRATDGKTKISCSVSLESAVNDFLCRYDCTCQENHYKVD